MTKKAAELPNLRDLDEELHRASQLLAYTANSFLENLEDDSQANLLWDPLLPGLRSRQIAKHSAGISLNVEDFSLLIERHEKRIELGLDSKSMLEVLEDLEKTFSDLGISGFNAKANYEEPFPDGDKKFERPSVEDLNALIQMRNEAWETIEGLLKEIRPAKFEMPRIWPHHFDIGAMVYGSKEYSDLSIGIGFAIPDMMMDAHYYYVSAWKGHEPQVPADDAGLSFGRWIRDDWNGAVLEYSHDRQKAKSFLVDAIMAFFK